MAAFIRLNTTEIRKRLEEFGYTDSKFGNIDNDSIATSDYTKHYTIIPHEWYDRIDCSWKCNDRIDCGIDVEKIF